MDGIFRWGVNKIIGHLEPLTKIGLKSVLIFAVDTVNPRDETGTHATDLACRALQILRNHFKEKLLLCADVCLCTSTNHGHCGVFYKNQPSSHAPEKLRDLTKTNQRLAEIALAYAKAGAHVIAPSDMQDGRIQAIKAILTVIYNPGSGVF